MRSKLPTREEVRDWVGLVKGVLEILAIIVAGAWAYSKYRETDMPQLQPRMSAISSLNWYRGSTKNTCLASFSVRLKNIGKAPVSVTSARLRVWLVDSEDDGTTTYLDPNSLTPDPPIFDKQLSSMRDSALITNYPLEIEQQEDFTFKLKRAESRIALFSFRAETTAGTVEESRWSYICDLPQ